MVIEDWGHQQVLLAALAVAVVAALAEWLHARRLRPVARLAFGPEARPALWARGAPTLRVVACAALAWGLLTLMTIEPVAHARNEDGLSREGADRHVLMVLDVSPSMRLVDSGPTANLSRMQRANEVLESFFRRVPLERYRISVVAAYNGAKPVVVDTSDVEVVRNILGDLPMHYAFQPGKTKLLDGLEEAFELARPWNPGSTVLLLVSDGDTVPAQGMPRRPASISDVLVVGVGDPVTGRFIDGRQSRQDVATLRQIATRLGGSFHDGNQHHLPTQLIGGLGGGDGESALERLTRREYALIAVGLGAALLALLPLLLAVAGTRHRPGRRPLRAGARVGTATPSGRVPVESTAVIRSG